MYNTAIGKCRKPLTYKLISPLKVPSSAPKKPQLFVILLILIGTG